MKIKESTVFYRGTDRNGLKPGGKPSVLSLPLDTPVLWGAHWLSSLGKGLISQC